MKTNEVIKQKILQYFPEILAVYLFGNFGTENEWADSDVDVALLFPHEKAKEIGLLLSGDLHLRLESYLNLN